MLLPSGFSHTIIFDPDYARVRSLSALETWSLLGGESNTFFRVGIPYREQALLCTTPVALQMFLTGLGLGSLVHFSPPTARSGGQENRNFFRPCSPSLIVMPAPPRYPRQESISRHLSRLLRHGPNSREPSLPLDLEDGGSISINVLLEYPTFKKMRAARSEILDAAQERDPSNKLRFDLAPTADGAKIRCFQCHTLIVSRQEEPTHAEHHRYLIHATSPENARAILKEGTKQPSGRREFHFVEVEYDNRQAQYIINNKNNRATRVWLVLDAMLAHGLGYTFSKLSNGVVVSPGINSHIHKGVFISAWLSDTQRISAPQLIQSADNLVTIDHDGNHPPPRLLDVPLDVIIRKRSRSPVRSPSPVLPSVPDYSPASPTPSQLDLPEQERPASWTPSEEAPTKRTKAASVASSASVTTAAAAASPVISPLAPPPASRNFSQEGFVPVSTKAPILTPSSSALALQETIEESVAREVERRLAHLGQPPVLRPAQSLGYGPSTLLLRPAVTMPAASSWNALNTYQVLEPITTAPPPVPERNEEDDDEDDEEEAHDFAPATINECLQQAYDFERDFHMRGEPPFPHKRLNRTTDPAARRRITKRYNARLKRARASEEEQRHIKWRALQRRAAKAAHSGRVRLVLLVNVFLNLVMRFLLPLCGGLLLNPSRPDLYGPTHHLRAVLALLVVTRSIGDICDKIPLGQYDVHKLLITSHLVYNALTWGGRKVREWASSPQNSKKREYNHGGCIEIASFYPGLLL